MTDKLRNFMRASDVVEEKLRFPLIVQPKADGVRGGVHPHGVITTRQLKPFENRHTAALFSKKKFAGLDGELYVGDSPCAPGLCRATTSATSTILGEPDVRMVAFDLVLPSTVLLPYIARLERLAKFVERGSFGDLVKLTEWAEAKDLDELLRHEERWLSQGFEGLIVRGMGNVHKEGYSTVKEGGLLRLKRFVDGEVEVLSVSEGQHNGNEAKVGLTGKVERSSHKANKSGNGLVGSMEGRVLKDVTWRGQVVLAKGQVVTVSAGCMTRDERAAAMKDPSLLVGKVAKFQFFPTGTKDKPRFPTFQSLRSKRDL